MSETAPPRSRAGSRPVPTGADRVALHDLHDRVLPADPGRGCLLPQPGL